MREPLRDIVAMCVNDMTAAISRYTSRSRLRRDRVSDVESFIYRQTISRLERILEKQSTSRNFVWNADRIYNDYRESISTNSTTLVPLLSGGRRFAVRKRTD